MATKRTNWKEARGSNRFHAYWYSFDSTGVEPVDEVLCSVAAAGKARHNTEGWTDEDSGYGKLSCTDEIQAAANEAAKHMRAQAEELDYLRDQNGRALVKISETFPNRVFDPAIGLPYYVGVLCAEFLETREALNDWTSACSCGHPMEDHENLGEDGIGCAFEDCQVGCLPCCPAISNELKRLRAARESE